MHNSPREFRIRDARYLSRVRSHGCLICGMPAQAHHLTKAEWTGTGMKVGDNWTVPLCALCHHDLHRFGDEQTWWDMNGVDPFAWAIQEWKDYDAAHHRQ